MQYIKGLIRRCLNLIYYIFELLSEKYTIYTFW